MGRDDREAVAQLVKIRGRHLSKIDLHEGSYEPLTDIEEIEGLAADYTWDQPDLRRGQRITRLVLAAAPLVPNERHRDRVHKLFGLYPGLKAIEVAQELRELAKEELGETEANATTVLQRDRAALASLARIMKQLSEQRVKARDIADRTDGAQAPAAEETSLGRALHHVVRTLRTRTEHAQPGARDDIKSVLNRFHEWPAGDGEADDVLTELDSISRQYIGCSVHHLMGRMKTNVRPPECPPDKKHHLLNYPTGKAMTLVTGGIEPFTGETVEPFYMAVFPVTRHEWQFFLNVFNWEPTPEWAGWARLFADLDLSRRPAVSMTFYDCVAYCYWLWMTTSYRFRLPTEAEWNFAATGGARQVFPWGDAVRHDLGRFDARSMVDVDQLPAVGPYGISGQAGNIWEYTSTLWRAEVPIPDSNILIPDLPFALWSSGWWTADGRTPIRKSRWSEDTKLVIKGGSYSLGAKYSEVKSRQYSSLFNSGAFGGFRLAVSARRDERTGEYFLEPSPYVVSGMENGLYLAPGEVLAAELIDMAQSAAVVSGCGGGTASKQTDSGDLADLVREQAT